MTTPMTFGIVGAGLIGQSWAALCLAFGHRVIAVDPREEAAGDLAAFSASAWPHLRALGFTTAEEPPAALVSRDVGSLGGVDVVLECGPERIEVKLDLVATLEEVIEADLILHVRDMSDPDRKSQAADVEAILKSLGIGEGDGRKLIEVWNKIDLLDDDAAEDLKLRAEKSENAIALSSVTGEGVDTLLSVIEARISGELVTRTVTLTTRQLPIMSWIYDRGRVKSRIDHEDGSVEIIAEFTASDNLDLDRQLGLGPKPDMDF